MRIFRRVIMPVAWLAVFSVMAVALAKIAFVDGLASEPVQAGPGANVAVPVVQATRATVTNTVQIKATVQSDPATSIRSTAAGKVTHIFLQPGAAVAEGESLYQVRSEATVEPQSAEASSTTAANQPGGQAALQPARTPASPVYAYTDVVAPAAGTLETLTVLLDQQVAVGEAAGTVNPGTFTVTGPVDASQQYRLLAKPGSAQISVVGGPAPFSCPSVVLKNNAAGEGGGAAGGAGGVSGGVGRSVPYAAAIPGGGAPPEQGGTPTGTLSCAIPPGAEVFAGLGATMTVTAGQANNVITVPLTAVKGSVKEGIVWLAAAGNTAGNSAGTSGPDAGDTSGTAPGAPAGSAAPEQRTVALGLNDGSVVEVLSGLAEGEQVLEFVPGAAAPGQPGPNFAGPGSYPAGG